MSSWQGETAPAAAAAPPGTPACAIVEGMPKPFRQSIRARRQLRAVRGKGNPDGFCAEIDCSLKQKFSREGLIEQPAIDARPDRAPLFLMASAYNGGFVRPGRAMAPNATIYKIELQLSDMDRHYYATHALTLARHPSETDERMMVRLLAFALYADERLEFGKGLSNDEEPDLWRKELNGDIALWIDLGQPDPVRVRKACARARKVIVVNYGGRSADIWWEKSADTLQRLKNLDVIDIASESVDALAALSERGLRVQCLIQDGHVQILTTDSVIGIDPRPRMTSNPPGR